LLLIGDPVLRRSAHEGDTGERCEGALSEMRPHGTPPAMTIMAARADAIEDCRVSALCAQLVRAVGAITVGLADSVG